MTRIITPAFLAPCLLTLTTDQRRSLNDSICNDEDSSDAELAEHWKDQIGLTDDQARAALEHRSHCLMPFGQLFNL